MKALIVEDETAASRNLVAILKDVAPEIQVVAILESISDTITWFKNNQQPDVLFMDIHLSDGSAFHIFEKIEITSPIIFVTAYDQYALDAFKVNSIDYILKPVNALAIQHALKKMTRLETGQTFEIIKEIGKRIQMQQELTNLLIIAGDKLLPLALDKIAFFFTKKEKVYVYTINGDVYLIDKTLDSLTNILPTYSFYRVNRQFIISARSIVDVEFWFGNRLRVNVIIDAPEDIIISKSRVADFKNWLQACRA